MNFTITSVYQCADVEEFQRVVGLTVQKGKMLISKITFFFLGALFFITGCSMALGEGGSAWAVGGIVAGVVLCIPGVFHYKYLAASAWRRWKRNNGGRPITYTFDSEGMVERMEGNTYRNRYTEIYACFETEGYFFLFLSKREGYILKKADFTEGKPEKFKAALEKWCGGRIKVYPVAGRR